LAYGGIQKNFEADVRMSKANQCIIRHVEYIGDVTSQFGSFLARGFPLNPGMSVVFPWLSVIASNWEKYRFRKLCFLYRAKSATTEAGSVISMVDYDAQDLPPNGKQTMMGSNYVDSNTWQSHEYNCLSSNLGDTMNYRYVRITAVPPNTDQRMYDLGVYYIATDGGAGSGQIGELHVAYEIELKTPQTINSLVSNLGSYISDNGSAKTNNTLLGVSPVLDSLYPAIGYEINAGSSTIDVYSIGTFIMDLVTTGTAFGAWAAPVIIGGTGALLSSYSIINAASTLASYFQIFQVTSLPFKLRLPALTSASSVLTGTLRLSPYSYDRLND